jgi:membrane-associated phospholipid phosphatase
MLAMVVLIAAPSFVRAVGREVKQYGSDAVALVRAPAGWDEQTWKRVGMLVAADGAAFAADQDIADTVQRNRTHFTDEFARAVTPLGGGRALQISVVTLAGGLLSHNAAIRDTGRDAVEASILASGVITPALKRVAGRSRPNAGEGAYAFDPFSDNESFPSGHATNAFAVAAVFAAHSKGWVVPTIAYTLATGVAASRVNDNVHYTSDVIAGAAIGTMVGRSIVARHRRNASPRAAASSITWMIVPAGRGASIQFSVPLERLHALARR